MTVVANAVAAVASNFLQILKSLVASRVLSLEAGEILVSGNNIFEETVIQTKFMGCQKAKTSLHNVTVASVLLILDHRLKIKS